MRSIISTLILILMLPALVHCMRDKETVTIRDNNPPTQVYNCVCYNYARTSVLWSGRCTTIMGVHDANNNLYYTVWPYPSGSSFNVYGRCWTR